MTVRTDRGKPLIIVLGLVAIMVVLYFAARALERSRPSAPRSDAGIAVSEVLGGESNAGFARAEQGRRFSFPRDHGPHPGFRTEWWYFTGNLHATSGRHFGYELSLFRIALDPAPPERESAWASHQVYMGHFAVTDTAGARFHAFERLARDALGLAGAQAEPFHVWVEDWEVRASAEARFPWRLRAREGSIGLDLELVGRKPVVLQGEDGLSRKSAQPGNASYYYSIPRLSTVGALTVGDETWSVSGESWLDREWGTSALGADQVGWDWFAVQLSDGQDVMFYQLRRRDGTADPFSSGALIDAEGDSRALSRDDVILQVRDRWTSPRGGDYPMRWRLSIPSAELSLDIVPVLEDQELDLRVRYWEGAVRVSGHRGGQPVHGVGYVELTGYAAAAR